MGRPVAVVAVGWVPYLREFLAVSVDRYVARKLVVAQESQGATVGERMLGDGYGFGLQCVFLVDKLGGDRFGNRAVFAARDGQVWSVAAVRLRVFEDGERGPRSPAR